MPSPDQSKSARRPSPPDGAKRPPPDSPTPKGSGMPRRTGNDPRLVVSLMAAVTVAAFLGGYTLGDMNDSDVIARSEPTGLQEADKAESGQLRAAISIDDDPILGEPNAPVTIVEFSDFQCPFCARFHQETLPRIEQEYISTGVVNLVYRDMPLQSHENAIPAHIAAECADVQGAFWAYHDILFERQREWRDAGDAELNAKLQEYAAELNLDSSFGACTRSSSISEEIAADVAQARSYGVGATPTFFVGNAESGYVMIEGAKPFSEFKSAIDATLT